MHKNQSYCVTVVLAHYSPTTKFCYLRSIVKHPEQSFRKGANNYCKGNDFDDSEVFVLGR